MSELEEIAKEHVERVGPSLGVGDHTYSPQFPEDRDDVCAVRRMAEDGHSYGFDTVYLVWQGEQGIDHEELVNTRSSKDYAHIEDIAEEEDDIVVKVGSGGSYSGEPWSRTYRRSKDRLGLVRD